MRDHRDTDASTESEPSRAPDLFVPDTTQHGETTAVDLQKLEKRLGARLRQFRRPRMLKLISALMVMSSTSLMAQARQAAAPQRLEQSMAGSNRLGISRTALSDATVAHTGNAAVQEIRLRHRGPGVALMIVGVAGVITGLLLEESLITVLGAGTGLVGLFLYLR